MSAKILIDAVKETLRARGVTYAQLAKGIGVSESTVKRMLNAAADVTLGRLDEICEFLDVTFEELLERPKTADAGRLSDEQEGALARDLDLLQLFYATRTVKDVKDVARYTRKSERSVRGAMRELESVDLLDRDVGDRVRPRGAANPDWAPDGPLSAQYFPDMYRDFQAADFAGELEARHFKCYLLSPESAALIRRRLLAIFAELGDLSRLDLRFARDRIIPWCAHFAARPYVPTFFDKSFSFPSMQKLRELFPSVLRD